VEYSSTQIHPVQLLLNDICFWMKPFQLQFSLCQWQGFIYWGGGREEASPPKKPASPPKKSLLKCKGWLMAC